MPIPAFHLAFPVSDLEATRTFYVERLGCAVGREDDRWIDFDFFGHQITAHLVDDDVWSDEATNTVDGAAVPVRHFGMILAWEAWHDARDRLTADGVEFLIEPHIRFEGEVGEQATLFLRDPSGNGLELKAFREPRSIFAR